MLVNINVDNTNFEIVNSVYLDQMMQKKIKSKKIGNWKCGRLNEPKTKHYNSVDVNDN